MVAKDDFYKVYRKTEGSFLSLIKNSFVKIMVTHHKFVSLQNDY